MQKLLINISVITISTIGIFTHPQISHADQNWDWERNLYTNPNQYWEMYANKPLVQKTNAKNEITYAITANPKNQYFKAWQYAINQYNKLGIIKLIPTTENNAQIRLKGSYNFEKGEALSSTATNAKPDLDGAYGLTVYKEITSDDQNNYMYDTICTLATSMSFYNGMSHYKAVAEHELGHALGFNHNNNKINGKYTVMLSGFDYDFNPHKYTPQSIGAYEQQALLDHYGKSNA